jgi:hypothetical protein
MDEFAEINRRVFRTFARLPVNFVICHDDIMTSRKPVCSPKWMHKYIFPRYEEFWGMLKSTGKHVIFMVDGCIDAYADEYSPAVQEALSVSHIPTIRLLHVSIKIALLPARVITAYSLAISLRKSRLWLKAWSRLLT